MRAILAIGVFLTWMVLVGTITLSEIVLGIIVALTAQFLFAPMFSRVMGMRPVPKSGIRSTIRRVGYGFVALGLFIVEVFASAYRVSAIILGKSSEISSELLVFPLKLHTPLAVTILSTMVTLTPGTLAVDYVPEKGVLYIHSLQKIKYGHSLQTVRRLESLIGKVAE